MALATRAASARTFRLEIDADDAGFLAGNTFSRSNRTRAPRSSGVMRSGSLPMPMKDRTVLSGDTPFSTGSNFRQFRQFELLSVIAEFARQHQLHLTVTACSST